MSLVAPDNRWHKCHLYVEQNITARTETRRYLLLKIRQMPTQTSASRGYVLFDIKMAFMPSVVWCRKGHTRILKLSAGCGHILRSVQSLERHRSSRMPDAVWLEIPDFAIRIPPAAVSTTVSELMSIYTTARKKSSATAAQRQAAHN